MLCNRDESPRRAPAELPVVTECGPRQAVFPRDPQGGGTWIGVNDTGLTLTLLNYNLPNRPQRQPHWTSRGVLIPQLLRFANTAEVLAAARLLDAAQTAPFRMVVLDGQNRGLIVSDSTELRIIERPQDETPLVFASSGLGDHVVTPPREALFEEMVEEAARDARMGAQDRYHRHSWDDRRDVSVCMSRDGAETLSCTEVLVTADIVTMRYLPQPPDQDGTWSAVTLSRVHSA